MQYNWPKNLDNQSATYKSQGVHKNRDSTAKMSVDAMDRDGVTDSQKAAAEAAAAATAKNLDNAVAGISPDEKIGNVGKDATQEGAAAVNRASAKNIEGVEPGHIAWYPTPFQGTQASYGDGAPQGSNAARLEQDELKSDMAGAAASGYMSGGMEGAGQGMAGAGMGAISANIGQDIASKDDTVDQATEALFQDDSVGEAHRAIADRLQGR